MRPFKMNMAGPSELTKNHLPHIKVEDRFYTKICRILGIPYPILQGALGGVAGPALVAAVSNAGGLGVLPAWGLTQEQLRTNIRKTRELTSQPFGVNIIPLNPNFTRSRSELAADEGVRIVTTGRGDPRRPVVSYLKSRGLTVIGVVPTVRHALRLEEEGVDAVVASGCEAGGHVGQVGTMPLVPQVVDAVKVPVIAAGGIADPRGFVAAIALGASGIQMGTRFVATLESEASPQEKERILQAIDEDNVITDLFTGKPVRVLRSPPLDGVLRAFEAGSSREELGRAITELRRKKIRKDPDFVSLASGQGAGLIKEILPAGEIIREIIRGAVEICDRLDQIRSLPR